MGIKVWTYPTAAAAQDVFNEYQNSEWCVFDSVPFGIHRFWTMNSVMIRQPVPGVSGTVKTYFCWLFIWWRVDHFTPPCYCWAFTSSDLRGCWASSACFVLDQVLGFFPDLLVLKAGFLCTGTKGQSSSLVFEYQCAFSVKDSRCVSTQRQSNIEHLDLLL